MKILGLESSAKSASVALTENGAVLARSFQNTGLTHSRTLLPMAEAMLQNCGLTMADMGAVAVAAGPGSFTGLRIGVSAAKGLAWAAELPCAGVSTLEAMAQNLAHLENTVIVCAMDARRNQVYNALFEIRSGQPVRLTEDRPIALEELIAELTAELTAMGREPYLVGDGAQLCKTRFDAAGLKCRLSPEPVRYQNAWGVAVSAERGKAISGEELLPVYLRLSQAERERLARLNKE